jgi:hypothetical protein
MDNWLQWAITTIIAVLAILAGRAWERYDRRSKKDKELFDKIIEIVPADSDSLLFLRGHDFAGLYHRDQIKPIRELGVLLGQPGFFFLNKELENIRRKLHHEIESFLAYLSTKAFRSETLPDSYGLVSPHESADLRIQRRRYMGEPLSKEEENRLHGELRRDFETDRNNLNNFAEKISGLYDELMIAARKTL